MADTISRSPRRQDLSALRLLRRDAMGSEIVRSWLLDPLLYLNDKWLTTFCRNYGWSKTTGERALSDLLDEGGLDLDRPDFWVSGFNGRLADEAEALAKRNGQRIECRAAAHV